MDIVNRITLLFSFVFSLFFLDGFGQPDVTTMDIKKPAKYENRVLGAEKSATTKFTKVRRFMQDNITHYNYYFNANNKLNLVIEKARIGNKDNFAEFLSIGASGVVLGKIVTNAANPEEEIAYFSNIIGKKE